MTQEKFQPARVKAIREALGMNMVQFSRHCRVTRQTVYNWETGASPIEGPAYVLLNIFGEQVDA